MDSSGTEISMNGTTGKTTNDSKIFAFASTKRELLDAETTSRLISEVMENATPEEFDTIRL